MGAARGFWDAAKHPRGVHGHFGSGSGGRVVKAKGKPKRKPAWYETKRVLFNHDEAYAAAKASRSAPSRVKVTRIAPGVAKLDGAYRDVRVKEVFNRKTATFNQVGYQPQHPGYFHEVLARKQDTKLRARHLMGLAHKR